MHFDEIDDRDVAETWRERYLLLPADELEPLGDDEVYIHELPGMRVELEYGRRRRHVDGTYELPQGLTLDVKRPTIASTVLDPVRPHRDERRSRGAGDHDRSAGGAAG